VNYERPFVVEDEWTFDLGKSCPTLLEVWATACNRSSEASYRAYAQHPAEKHLPVVSSMSLLQVGVNPNGDPIFQATVAYDLKSTAGSLSIGTENWVSADGQEHPAVTLETIQVPNNPTSGTNVFTFTGWKGQHDSHEQVVALFGRGWTTLLDRRLVLHPRHGSRKRADPGRHDRDRSIAMECGGRSHRFRMFVLRANIQKRQLRLPHSRRFRRTDPSPLRRFDHDSNE
jgi:hypothetical protein